jgi:hypothetical protein
MLTVRMTVRIDTRRVVDFGAILLAFGAIIALGANGVVY